MEGAAGAVEVSAEPTATERMFATAGGAAFLGSLLGAALTSAPVRKAIAPRAPSVAHGLARAWAAHHETQRPREVMLALSDAAHDDGSDSSSWTIFWSLEDALKDRRDDDLHTATIRPCRTAFPNGAHTTIAGWLLEHVNQASRVAEWADFWMTSEDAVYITTGAPEQRRALKIDLANRIAAALRGWAEAHGCHDRNAGPVEINAWKFTGPEQRYVYDGKRWKPAEEKL